MTARPPPLTIGDIIKIASFTLAPLTAWLYVTGWSYAYAYFDHFRIPLLMVDLPIEHLLVYGGLVIWKNGLWAVVVLAFLAAILWACRRYAELVGQVGLAGMGLGLVIIVLILGRLGGISTAWDDFQIQRDHDYRAYPRVRLALAKDAASLDNAAIADLVITDCGRLILHNQDRLFLIRPVKEASLDLDTFVIPWSDVAALRVTSMYHSCP